MVWPIPKTFRSLALGLALGVLIPVAVIGFGLRLYVDHHYRRYIPEQVPITSLKAERSEGWFSGCGGAIFSMQPEEAARLRREGLSAFEGRMVGRGFTHARRPVVWSDWRATTTRTSLGDGPHPGLICLRSPMQDQIVEALMRPGSYTAWSDGAQLVVIPDLNVVVFLFYD
jgi:hypothetical protein